MDLARTYQRLLERLKRGLIVGSPSGLRPVELLLHQLIQWGSQIGILGHKVAKEQGTAKEALRLLGGLREGPAQDGILALLRQLVGVVAAEVAKELNLLKAEPGLAELENNVAVNAALENLG